jgi:hypothetical protein
MFKERIKNVQQILKTFTGLNGEPGDEKEKYLLRSMWIMSCAEFEGSIKDLAETYIDNVKKTKNINQMHVCFLIQNFFGNKEEKDNFSINQILGLYKKKKSDITYQNFTKNKKAIYKSFSVEYLFNSLGIFFKEKEQTDLKLLDGIASTRDAISHGDYQISITRKQLEDNIKILKKIYTKLKNKFK